MATTQALKPPIGVFTKYPELPKDIRLMIMEEVIQAVRQEHAEDGDWSSGTTKPCLSLFSGLDYEWNRAIEMILFDSIKIIPSALSDFAKFCSKRHGRLNTVRLSISNEHIPVDVQPEYYIGNAVAQLLNVMKDWGPIGREREGLIEVQLDFYYVWIHSQISHNISTGLGVLPKVPIIGALYEVVQGPIHPSSSLRLYQNLPNVRHVSLNLRFLDDENTSLEEASNTIASLGTAQPNLTRLELEPDLHWSHQTSTWKFWTPASDCIAAFPHSWYNSLVQLDLKRVKDLPLFLAAAGKIAWPNLEKLSLIGELESGIETRNKLEAMSNRVCTDLVRGVITILPKTPNIMEIMIDMEDFSWDPYKSPFWAFFRFELCLGNSARWGEAGLAPYSYKFVPSYDNGTAAAAGTDFSGHVATELQHIVRKHQLKDLEVFYSEEESTWGCGRFCRQWASEKNSWDAVFENEADEFIHQMGQYIDLV